MIRVRPMHGLCNRLRAIASARALARERGDALEVHWDVAYDMNARFSDLFEEPEDFRLVEDGSGAGFFSPANPDYRGEAVMHRNHGAFDAYVREILSSPVSRDFAFDSFADFHGGDFGWLRPKPEIADEVASLRARLPPEFIGLHVRRTDNFKSRVYSPLRLFVRAVRRELRRAPALGVFLATDDVRTKRVLRRKFGNRLFTRDDVADRAAPSGVRDAVVDLLLLSRATRIYGSYWSSFSETAARMGGADFVRLEARGLGRVWADFRLFLEDRRRRRMT